MRSNSSSAPQAAPPPSVAVEAEGGARETRAPISPPRSVKITSASSRTRESPSLRSIPSSGSFWSCCSRRRDRSDRQDHRGIFHS